MPWARPVSLGLRALHLAAIALLLGGHAFGASAETLFPWLIGAVISGVGLAICDVLAWGLYWFAMGKGVSVLAKLAMLLVIPFAWNARVAILSVALVAAAVTSHMPARLRNYSFVHRRVLDPGGPLAHRSALEVLGPPRAFSGVIPGNREATPPGRPGSKDHPLR